MSYWWYVFGAVFVALSVMDLLQTLALQRLGAVENNPLLGKHPRPGVLIAFGTVTTALWVAAALFLTYKQAPWIEAVWMLGIGLRVKTVVQGRKLHKELRHADTSSASVPE
jgi:hypothetical protein